MAANRDSGPPLQIDELTINAIMEDLRVDAITDADLAALFEGPCKILNTFDWGKIELRGTKPDSEGVLFRVLTNSVTPAFLPDQVPVHRCILPFRRITTNNGSTALISQYQSQSLTDALKQLDRGESPSFFTHAGMVKFFIGAASAIAALHKAGLGGWGFVRDAVVFDAGGNALLDAGLLAIKDRKGDPAIDIAEFLSLTYEILMLHPVAKRNLMTRLAAPSVVTFLKRGLSRAGRPASDRLVLEFVKNLPPLFLTSSLTVEAGFGQPFEVGDFMAWLRYVDPGVVCEIEKSEDPVLKSLVSEVPAADLTKVDSVRRGWLLCGMGVRSKEQPETAWQLFQAAIDAGDVRANFYLASLMFESDRTRAMKLYAIGSEAGDCLSMERLAFGQMTGYGVPQNRGGGQKLLERAAGYGEPLVCARFAESLMERAGRDADQRARVFLERAAKGGNVAALKAFLDLFAQHDGDVRNQADRVRRFAAMNGDARALYKLKRFEAAAALGWPKAMYRLGEARLAAGDEAGGRRWFEYAGSRGCRTATLALARLCEDSDPAGATRLYVEANTRVAWLSAGILSWRGGDRVAAREHFKAAGFLPMTNDERLRWLEKLGNGADIKPFIMDDVRILDVMAPLEDVAVDLRPGDRNCFRWCSDSGPVWYREDLAASSSDGAFGVFARVHSVSEVVDQVVSEVQQVGMAVGRAAVGESISIEDSLRKCGGSWPDVLKTLARFYCAELFLYRHVATMPKVSFVLREACLGPTAMLQRSDEPMVYRVGQLRLDVLADFARRIHGLVHFPSLTLCTSLLERVRELPGNTLFAIQLTTPITSLSDLSMVQIPPEAECVFGPNLILEVTEVVWVPDMGKWRVSLTTHEQKPFPPTTPLANAAPTPAPLEKIPAPLPIEAAAEAPMAPPPLPGDAAAAPLGSQAPQLGKTQSQPFALPGLGSIGVSDASAFVSRVEVKTALPSLPPVGAMGKPRITGIPLARKPSMRLPESSLGDPPASISKSGALPAPPPIFPPIGGFQLPELRLDSKGPAAPVVAPVEEPQKVVVEEVISVEEGKASPGAGKVVVEEQTRVTVVEAPHVEQNWQSLMSALRAPTGGL